MKERLKMTYIKLSTNSIFTQKELDLLTKNNFDSSLLLDMAFNTETNGNIEKRLDNTFVYHQNGEIVLEAKTLKKLLNKIDKFSQKK